MQHDQDEEAAREIIPPNWRAETAATSLMPPMEMVVSSRCAGDLRDRIAAALRAARQEGGRQMREEAMGVAIAVKNDNETSLEAMSMCQKRHEHRLLAPAGGIAAAERIAAAIRALPLPGEKA